jgi:hypothetical protein
MLLFKKKKTTNQAITSVGEDTEISGTLVYCQWEF